MTRPPRLIFVGFTAVPLPSAYVRAKGAQDPVWAYGFLTPPAWNDKAAPPQNPPTHNLRANEDRDDQLRLRRVDGSSASYAFVDVRDRHNVIDWFPGEHPSPMPELIAHGPQKLGANSRRVGSCHLPNAKGRPEHAQ